MASKDPGSQAGAKLTYKDQLDETAHKAKYGSQDNETDGGDGGIVNQVAEKGEPTGLLNVVYEHLPPNHSVPVRPGRWQSSRHGEERSCQRFSAPLWASRPSSQ